MPRTDLHNIRALISSRRFCDPGRFSNVDCAIIHAMPSHKTQPHMYCSLSLCVWWLDMCCIQHQEQEQAQSISWPRCRPHWDGRALIQPFINALEKWMYNERIEKNSGQTKICGSRSSRAIVQPASGAGATSLTRHLHLVAQQMSVYVCECSHKLYATQHIMCSAVTLGWVWWATGMIRA